MSKLKSINPRPNFPELEEEVLRFWNEKGIFQKTLDKTRNGTPFVFFEGPPTANAAPAIHHVEARAFKDLIPRYQTMRGRFINRKAGWDTHGLPVELQVEKALGISGKNQIESIKPTVRESIIEFNRLCRESVWQYKEEWEKLTARMGYWVDMNDPYITYQNSYIESIWWILKTVWDQGDIYLGHKVVPYCPRCGTALSSHEVAQGYKNVSDTSVYTKFKLKSKPNTYILSWTTTPWTLPGNVALAVGENIDYVEAKVGDEHLILAKDLAGQVLIGENDVTRSFKGHELVGLEYEPLFDVPKLASDKSYKVYAADFVTTTDGTGVVHTAVMYGEEDYELGEKIGLPKFHTVDETGHFVESVPDVAGMYAKDKKTEEKILDHLKARGYFLKTEEYSHDYPFCWRCGTALLYYARDSWFIRMSRYREKLLSNNDQINWVPEYIKNGRFGEWLTDAKDWAISRERYWGTPIPIWKCDSCGEFHMVGSVKELNLTSNTFYFMRHGEAELNVQKIVQTSLERDTHHLTENGRNIVAGSAEQLKSSGGIDLIYSSEFLRTRETAEIMKEKTGAKMIVDRRLDELNCGSYNGRLYEEFDHDFPQATRWTKMPAGGETWTQAQKRLVEAINEINQQNTSKRILIVSHGDPLMILQQYFGMSRPYPRKGIVFELNVGIHDLHRPYIDDVVLKCEKCGKDAHRIEQVMDVWFDSGAMPYAQWHYPFENKEKIDGTHKALDMIKSAWDAHALHRQFPADYISEAIDQTRGWFYTLLAISTLLGRGPAYKNVINLGHLLDEKGQKMSKSKGNVVDPKNVINSHGVDGLRWYMYSVNQPGDSKLFAVRDVELIIRKNFLTLWNVLSFLVTYANNDSWEPGHAAEGEVLDEWMRAKTKELVLHVTRSLDAFDVFHAARAIEEFINELSTWYVRRSRERKGPAVYQTLYDTLKTLSIILAPFTPFLAENIWSALKQESDPESVHLADWPHAHELSSTEKENLRLMDLVRKFVEQGHALRKAANIKLRQPLNSFAYPSDENLPEFFASILADELNVKKVAAAGKMEFDTNITPELKQMGLAAEFARAVQEMRKKTGLKVGEWVNLSYDTEDPELIAALELFDTKKTYVRSVKQASGLVGEELEIDGKKATLSLQVE